ncbi:hypothetical protein D3C78_1941090 [compost metagenome]
MPAVALRDLFAAGVLAPNDFPFPPAGRSSLVVEAGAFFPGLLPGAAFPMPFPAVFGPEALPGVTFSIKSSST